MTPAEIAMLSGLARVVKRIKPATRLRYLTEAEVAGSSGVIATRYRELANQRGSAISFSLWLSLCRQVGARESKCRCLHCALAGCRIVLHAI
jgi:hypothetical protein